MSVPSVPLAGCQGARGSFLSAPASPQWLLYSSLCLRWIICWLCNGMPSWRNKQHFRKTMVDFYNMQSTNLYVSYCFLFYFLQVLLRDISIRMEKAIKVCHYREQREKWQLGCTYSCISFCYFQEKLNTVTKAALNSVTIGTLPKVQWLRLVLPMQGAWVQSLARELGSCMLHNAAKRKKKNSVMVFSKNPYY